MGDVTTTEELMAAIARCRHAKAWFDAGRRSEAMLAVVVADAAALADAVLARLSAADDGRCGTCRHWIPAHDYSPDSPNQLGDCSNITDFDEYGALVPDQRAGVLGARLGSLVTRSDFGCVLHEAREHTPGVPLAPAAGGGA